jgi:hypothetical protein
VIATVSEIPFRTLDCINLGFQYYGLKPMYKIFQIKSLNAGFKKNRPSRNPSVRYLPSVEVDEDFSNDYDAFSAMTHHVLPQLILKTKHIGVLWESLISFWGHIYCSSNPKLYVNPSIMAAFPTSVIPSSSSSSSSSSYSATISKLSTSSTSSFSTINNPDPNPNPNPNPIKTGSSSSNDPPPRFQINLKEVDILMEKFLYTPAIHVTATQVNFICTCILTCTEVNMYAICIYICMHIHL